MPDSELLNLKPVIALFAFASVVGMCIYIYGLLEGSYRFSVIGAAILGVSVNVSFAATTIYGYHRYYRGHNDE